MNATKSIQTIKILGGTSRFSLVCIGEKYFIGNNQDLDENLPRLPLSKELVWLYIQNLESYFDETPDNSEETRLYYESLFDNMCEEYFKDGY